MMADFLGEIEAKDVKKKKSQPSLELEEQNELADLETNQPNQACHNLPRPKPIGRIPRGPIYTPFKTVQEDSVN